MQVYTVAQISPRQDETPEGYLVCKGVPIARTGRMVYVAGEVPVTPGPDGLIHVDRTEEELFSSTTMSSFEGKPVTLDHPSDFVTTDSWPSLSQGHVFNVRRGEGVDSDLLMADVMVTRRQAIREIRAGLREVSCGYDADYEELSPGVAVQRNILGNHAALVKKGRCGSRCAIGDKEADLPKDHSILSRLLRLVPTKDQAAAKELIEEAKAKDSDKDDDDERRKKTDDEEMPSWAQSLLDRMDKFEAKVTSGEMPGTINNIETATVDGAPKAPARTADAAPDAWQAVVSGAEVIAPGFRLPTFDKAAVRTTDALCDCQRRAMAQAVAGTGATRDAVAKLLAGIDVAAAPAPTIDALFKAAVNVATEANNSAARPASRGTRDFGAAPKTPADINKQNREYWSRPRV